MKLHVQLNLRTNLASLPSPSGGLQRSAPVLGRTMPRVGKGSGIFECWCAAVRCCARGRCTLHASSSVRSAGRPGPQRPRSNARVKYFRTHRASNALRAGTSRAPQKNACKVQRGRAHSAGAYPPVSSVSELGSPGSSSAVLSLTPRLQPGGNLGYFRRTVSTVCRSGGKPLKRLILILAPQHRAEAAVLMRVLTKRSNLRAGWRCSLALT
jgi:hypothetical protein